MILYAQKRFHGYESTESHIDNYVIEQVNQLSSYEKVSRDKDKYQMFEWAQGIPILVETQEEVPDMIDEDELDVEDVPINDDNTVKEEDEDEQGLNITEEN